MTPRTIAGRYVVERAVGTGGMGTVWLCRDEVLGRDVAVKQVGTMPGESATDVARALREARSSAALNHPHVVSVFDTVEDGDQAWLVMEYVPSRTLAEIIAEDGALPLERAAFILAQAADGLAAAHARGTVHRDVKPGNILVGTDDHTKIMDFGISRTYGDAQLTRSGILTGTPMYFSPEIARGEDAGLPADVWALGATLYAAVEGRPPYPDPGNAIALLATIAAESPPPPVRAGVLAEPIRRMMEREPSARWSMGESARTLHGLHRSLLAGRASPTVTMPAPSPASAPATPVPPEAASEPEERRRRRGWLLPLVAVALLVLVILGGAVLLNQESGVEPTASQSGSPSPAGGRGSDSPTPADPTEQTTPTSPETSSEPAQPTESPTETATVAPAAGSSKAFAQEYYGLLPDDTRSAYDLLSPDYRAGLSYGEYDGFWSTIDGVEVRGASPVEGGTAVDVELTYTTSDGGTEDETRRLVLEQTAEGYLIAADAAV